jgi:hypothetical protein
VGASGRGRLGELVRDALATWAEVVKTAGIEVE